MKRFSARISLALIAGLTVSMVVGRLPAAEVSDSVLNAEKQRIAAIEKAKKTAVSVFANGGRGGGSGVVITPDGYALTNYHVSKPAGNTMSCSMPDGVLYDAVIVGIDPTGDVALIKLMGRDDFPHAELGDSDKLRTGDWCFAVGNPFLLATDFQPTVTYGIVSGVHRYQYPAGTLLEYADCIQTDASINPGNSGGPLFNAEGQLIGINGRGSFEKRGRVNVGVGYAISINQIKHFMGYLRSGRIVDHATLGATVSTDEEDGKVVVTNIADSSDAYRRGLRYGDEITAFGGRAIRTVNEFKNVLGIYPKGWRVPLTFIQDGEQRDVLVRLAGVHAGDELIKKIQPPTAPQPEKKDTPKKDAPDKENPEQENAEKDPPKADDEKTPLPKPGPKIPIPIPGPKVGGPQPIPKHLAQYFKERPGYTNYYFNELNRDRIWNNFQALGDFTPCTGTWRIVGKTIAGADVEFILAEDKATASMPGGDSLVNLKEDLGNQLEPSGSGGMLVALHLWKKMLTIGPKQFGDVYYLGTGPIPTQKELADILVATVGVVESRFMFDPQSGRLVGMEMYPDLDVDPCEVYFSEFKEADGRLVPHRIEVRFGNDVYSVLQLTEFDLETTEKN